MASKPEIRSRIMTGVLLSNDSIVATSVPALQDALGLGDVSLTQFRKALQSLHYKYQYLTWRRHYVPVVEHELSARCGIGGEAVIRRHLMTHGVVYVASLDELAKQIAGCPTRSELAASLRYQLVRMIELGSVSEIKEVDELNTDPRTPGGKMIMAYRLG